jgi:uncharacterized repeat protein (TIGR03803 family)
MNPKSEFKNRWWLQFKNILAVQAGVLLLCLAAANSPAQTYTILHSFGTNVMGLNPQAPLVQGPDGTLYGTASGGGSANQGQVFKENPDGSGYTVLKDFTGNDGANPEAGLVLSGTTLYGTTTGGGVYGAGTVFAINTDGSRFAVLKSFAGSDGANPYAGLVLSGATLYGTTVLGGSSGDGTVFSVNTDGTGFTTLYSFTGGSDGADPYAGLVLSGTTLYGTANGGGVYGAGTVFAVNTDGTGFTELYRFTGGSDGANPMAGLVLSGNTLYGTTGYGGSSGNGTVFAVNTDGTGFTVLKTFNGSDGAWPLGGLVLSGTTLFGTTWVGGSSFNGTVFSVNTDGTGFTVLKQFNGYDGANPAAGLVLSGTTLYGTTLYGGNDGCGTVFSVESDGSSYTVLTHFAGGDGATPYGSLELSGTTLYGTTLGGGASGNGTVFSVKTAGSGYAVLYSFTEPASNGSYNTNADGANPEAGLVLSGTTLYGTTFDGGSYGNGTVFAVNTNGSGNAVLYSFTEPIYSTNTDGANPEAGLVLAGTTLCGTTISGGNYGCGTVFAVNTDGTGFTNLYSFTATDPNTGTNSDGASPQAGLILSGNTLYGTALGGGSSGKGTVFAVNTDGTGFTTLYTFTATDPDTGTNSDGANPRAGLILSGNTLYGTASGGGSSGDGTVFAVNTDGTGFTTLHSFSGSDGANPQAGLILLGNTLYGTASGGGSFGNGTVFQINTDGSEFAVLKYFSGSDGANPYAGLVLSDTTFYGVTVNGGGLGDGVLFSLSPGPPMIASPPESQTAQAGSTIDFQVDASGYPPPSYQWFFNGTNAIDGATNSILEVTNVLFPQSGAYTVVITNAYGSVTSLVATLIVQDPIIITQPVSQTIHPWQTAVFSVVAGGTPPFSFQWFKDGLSLKDGGNISGAQTSTLTLSNVLVADAGGYWVIVSNAYGSVTGAVAVLAVSQALYSVLYDFGGSDGAGPCAGLTLSGNTLYGTTAGGGSSGDGTVFAVNTDGTGFTTLHSFAALPTYPGPFINNDGAYPVAGLTLSGNTLYGTTTLGGSSGNGTVFAVNTDGTGFTNLYSFTGGSDEGDPQAGLILLGNTLYGTVGGVGSSGYGTVFAVNTDGTDFTTLHSFSGNDGAGPQAGLILSGNTLYGTALGGGSSGGGTVFSLSFVPPTIITPPPSQTAETGSTVDFTVDAISSQPLTYQWLFNGTNLISCSTNCDLELTNVDFSLSGTYTAVVTNAFGAVTSSPAMLNVIPAIESSLVLGINVTGEAGSLLNVEYTDALGLAPNWLMLDTVTLTNTSQFCFDLNTPLPPQRFYRAWQTGTPSVVPSLNLNFVPAITLTGNVGDSLQLDYINPFGPTNAWVTLATITLTNTSQLYFDVSAIGQPARLYRIVPQP